MEAGVDLPIANTIVVEDATHLGVSQMYQLKGRVGRNSVKGYAWFFIRRLLPQLREVAYTLL